MYQRFTKISRRLAVITVSALMVSAVATPLALAGEPSKAAPGGANSNSPNTYVLQGDFANFGTGSTIFESPGDWNFISTGSSNEGISAHCQKGTDCWGVYAVGTSMGVRGTSNNPGSSFAAGVHGAGGSTAAGGGSYGGYFQAANGTSNSYGVYGSASNFGGYFTSDATAGSSGIYATGITQGVYGFSSAGRGVYAVSTSGDGLIAAGGNNGVVASATSAAGNGVYASGSGGAYYGVWAVTTNYGLVASTSAATGTNYGVWGNANGANPTSVGVYGLGATGVTGDSSNFIGVRGRITGSNANSYGGYFENTTGVGMYGFSTNYYGFFGGSQTSTGLVASSNGGTGGYFAGSCTVAPCTGAPGSYYGGVFEAGGTNTAARFIANVPSAGSRFAAIFDGNVAINGNYAATGTKSAMVDTNQGKRLLYATEGTQNIFTDQGTAKLVNGRAVIKIDLLFAQTVNLDKGYQVFLTPNSFDKISLGIGNKTSTSFEVREVLVGTGNFSFDWKIEALRKGYEADRLAPAPVVPDKPARPNLNPQLPAGQQDAPAPVMKAPPELPAQEAQPVAPAPPPDGKK